jgi:hypothetical protein
MRGPYEPSAEKFVDCVCQTLEINKSYTVYEAKKECGVSYETIRTYLTIGLHDIALRTAKKCKRILKPENVERVYKGFKVNPVIGDTGDSEAKKRDPCKTELASDEDDNRETWRPFKLFFKFQAFRSSRIPDIVVV